jgi:hypothetical protein
MSKTIVRIDQISDGGTNPETSIIEDVLWTLHFDNNGGVRTLGRNQMLMYLTSGTSPIKNVHSFKKWDIKTTQGNEIRTWVIVYDDHTHIQLTNKDFYSLIANGHRNKEEMDLKNENPEYSAETGDASQRGAVSKAIQQAQEEAAEKKQPITSPDERKKVDSFRDQVTKDSKFDDFRDLIRKDAAPHPDAKGYEDKH